MATARERVYQKIRTRIFSGKYSPGHQLKEEELAEDFAVSRTPVRMALRQLADEGLVTVRSNHRSYVSDVGETQFGEIFELIVFLESYSASLSARRVTPGQLGQLRRLVDEMEHLVRERPDDHRAFLENNAQFHRLIHSIHGNQKVKEVLDRVVNFPHNLYLKFGQINAQHNPKSVEEHRAIVEALAAGDPAFTALTFRMHSESVRRSFRELWARVDAKAPADDAAARAAAPSRSGGTRGRHGAG